MRSTVIPNLIMLHVSVRFRVLCFPLRLTQHTLACRFCSSTSETVTEPERKNWTEVRNKQKSKYPDGWKPKKKLTRYQMDYLRTLKQDYPDEWDVKKLSNQFGISSSAVVRILKSRWEPSPEVGEKQDKRAVELREQRRGEAEERKKQVGRTKKEAIVSERRTKKEAVVSEGRTKKEAVVSERRTKKEAIVSEQRTKKEAIVSEGRTKKEPIVSEGRTKNEAIISEQRKKEDN